MAFNQSCYGIRGKVGIADNDFIYYALRQAVAEMKQVAHGGVFDTITRDTFNIIECNLPPLPEQRAIAHILGTLDDKIELNRRMNETLEQMARALFKSWFVDFDPVRAKAAVHREHPNWTNEQVSQAACPNLNPEIAALFPDSFQDSELGAIPKGWSIGTLGDLVENVIDRIQPSAFTESHPYVPIECIDARTVCLVNWQPGSNARSSLIRFRKGDILLGAMRPYFHKVCIAPFDGSTRTTAFVLRPVSTELAYTAFVFSRDDTIEYATAHSEGSTIPYAKWVGSLQAMQIVLPTQDVRQEFHRLVWPLIERMMVNVSVGTNLAAIRDALLPKLISGQIRVKDAERFLERTETKNKTQIQTGGNYE
jgi:type I restriction enzyme S subunit